MFRVTGQTVYSRWETADIRLTAGCIHSRCRLFTGCVAFRHPLVTGCVDYRWQMVTGCEGLRYPVVTGCVDFRWQVVTGVVVSRWLLVIGCEDLRCPLVTRCVDFRCPSDTSTVDSRRQLVTGCLCHRAFLDLEETDLVERQISGWANSLVTIVIEMSRATVMSSVKLRWSGLNKEHCLFLAMQWLPCVSYEDKLSTAVIRQMGVWTTCFTERTLNIWRLTTTLVVVPHR